MVLIVIQIIIYGGFFKLIKDDGYVINELGKIRGQVQRVVKLELVDNKYSNKRKIVGNLINSYINNPFMMNANDLGLVRDINHIQQDWIELELLLDKYHHDPSKIMKNKVIIKSEEFWNLSNNAVYRAQKITEKRALYFKFFTLSFSVNVLAIVIIMFIFKKQIYDDLKLSAVHDPLTGAYNRRYFSEYIQHEISRGKRKNKVFCLIMLDIDFFKKVNDTYGHAKGDYVLKEVVTVVQRNIRNYDVLARIGGEEFVILLPDTSRDSAWHLAERVRKDIERYPLDGMPSITISLGLVELKEDDDRKSILERVDKAMYKAKESGRNRIEIG